MTVEVLRAPRVMPHRTIASRPKAKTAFDPIVYLYERLLPLEKVEALYADRQPDGFDIWIVVNNTAVADRERIYDQEWGLMQQFPNLGFDFRLIDRTQSALTDLVDLGDADLFMRFLR